MKRLSVFAALFIVCILVFSVTFEAFTASLPESNSDNTSIKIHFETGEMRRAADSVCVAVPVTAAYAKIAPVFDSTGALVSDPTGTMLNTNYSGCLSVSAMGADVKIAPVFNASGVVVSDPTGTILSVINP